MIKSIGECDPDYRRNPKTGHYCILCQRDLKPGQPYRMVHLINGGNDILHPSEYETHQQDSGEMGLHAVGMNCARKIGIEWTTTPSPQPGASE